MKKTVMIVGYVFVAFSVLSLVWASCLAWIAPKAVMALVHVELNNNDALSSIRGVYGGVGFSLVALIIVMAIKDLQKSLLFLGIFWLLYAISRVITIIVDGPLANFGNTWLKTELFFGILAWVIYCFNNRNVRKTKNL